MWFTKPMTRCSYVPLVGTGNWSFAAVLHVSARKPDVLDSGLHVGIALFNDYQIKCIPVLLACSNLTVQDRNNVCWKI